MLKRKEKKKKINIQNIPIRRDFWGTDVSSSDGFAGTLFGDFIVVEFDAIVDAGTPNSGTISNTAVVFNTGAIADSATTDAGARQKTKNTTKTKNTRQTKSNKTQDFTFTQK